MSPIGFPYGGNGGGTPSEDALTLEVRSSIPNTSGFSVGDLINVNGDVYELIASGDAGNILTGVAVARTSPYIGVPTLEWRSDDTGSDPVIAHLSRAVLGTSPPASIFIKFHTDSGFYSDENLVRDSSHDTNETFGYADGSVRFSPAVVGDKFTAQFFRGNDDSDPLTIHGQTDRWELEQRNHPDTSTSGQTQAQVDARIAAKVRDFAEQDKDVPVPASRLPVSSQSSAGIISSAQFTRLANALIGTDLSGAALLQNAGISIQDSVLVWDASANSFMRIVFNELDKRWRANQVPSGNKLPENPSVGDEFILLEDDLIQTDRVIKGNEVNGEEYTWSFPDTSGVTPHAIITYSSTFGGPGSATLAGKTVLQTAGAFSVPNDLQVAFYKTGQTRTLYNVADNPLPSFPHFYEISGLDFDTANDFQHFHAVNVESQSTNYALYPAITVNAGDLVFSGGNNGQGGWVLKPGIAAPWAVQGQPEPRTLLAITDLHDGSATGISPPNTSQQRINPFTAFSPTFTLTDGDNQHGIVQVDALLTIGNRSSSTLSFSQTDPELKSVRITEWVFVKDLRASTAYSASAQNGEMVGIWPVYVGNDKRGDVELYLAKNAADELGYYLYYRPSTGSDNFSTSLTLEVAFIHNDGAGISSEVNYESDFDPSRAAIAFPTGTEIQINVAVGTIQSGHGLSITNNNIVFAKSGRYTIIYSFNTQMTSNPRLSADARTFLHFIAKRIRGAATADLIYTRKTDYIRDVSNQTGSRTGPDAQNIQGSFEVLVQENDQIGFHLGSDLTQGTGVSMQVNSADSQIQVISTEIS